MKTRKDILRPIRQMVRSQCATFSAESNGKTNCCHFGPDRQPHCSFFREDGQYPGYLKKGLVRCVYFETRVLPADPAIELAYWGKHPEGTEGQTVGKCEQCQESFTKQSNRQKFCKDCRDEQNKKVTLARQRKKYWEDKTKNPTV